MANHGGYGILASDIRSREAMVNFAREIEARLVLPHPRGDGSVLTIVTRLRDNGVYEFRVENENREAVLEGTGNLLIDTGAVPREEPQ